MKIMIKKTLTFPLILLAACLILFEDFVWNKVTALTAIVARWQLVVRLERWVLARGRYTTLALFTVPIACLIPVKLVALYLIASGHLMTGILVIVAAKVTGTAVSARLFVIAKPKLMTFETFRTVYAKVLEFKAWAHGVLDRLQVPATIRRIKAGARALAAWVPKPAVARHYLVSRLLAAQRLMRRTR
ncbi:MAG: hypothetical protein HQL37_12955 [Alphaproteobacteria bacterium]|nr:hypothetical protein [Alphaproteobacteria bacterium]